MRSLWSVSLLFFETALDGVVWLWNKFAKNAPIISRDDWTDGT